MRISVSNQTLESAVNRGIRELRPRLKELWRNQSRAVDEDVVGNIIAHSVGVMVNGWSAETAKVINQHYVPLAQALWKTAVLEIDKEVSRQKAIDNYLLSRNYANGLRWIAARGAKLVTEIVESQRVALQHILLQPLTSGSSIEAMTEVIRGSVGLTTSQVMALARVRANLEAQNLAEGRVSKLVERYREQMLNYRAERIARTESSFVVHAAQDDVIRESVLTGELPHDIHRVWMTTQSDRMCEDCAARDGEVIGLESDDLPPLHPNCMCTVVYTTE